MKRQGKTMALDLDMQTAEIVGQALADDPRIADITLRQAIGIYTAEKAAQTIEHAKANSSFYAKKLGKLTVTDWAEIPFTTPDELIGNEEDFLCKAPETSDEADDKLQIFSTRGTTDEPKQIYMTKDEAEAASAFFESGMRMIVDETDTVLVITDTRESDAFRTLFMKGLERSGAKVIEKHISSKAEIEELPELIRSEGITSAAASPTHMVALARAAAREAASGKDEVFLRSILLGTEFVPDKTVMMLEDTFQAMIFEHYGMIEMGAGCAFSCGYGRGYHVREADVFVELINPITGEVVKGESPKTPGFSNYGEIVFTTLTRDAMPLIRYRTGDFSRWILQPCPCGSQLKRLDKVVPGEERELKENARR